MDLANKRIAVLDDEPDIVELIELNLSKTGFVVSAYTHTDDFYRGLSDNELPDLVLLDLMLPGIDGFEICKDMKRNPKLAGIPVIMLTARGDEIDRVLGLELGADDYITKPFSPKELIARIKAVLRRGAIVQTAVQTEPTPPESKKRVINSIVMDLERYEVTVEGAIVELTHTEFRILALLSEKRGWVYNRDQILDHLWGNEKMVIDRTIDVHIRHLREKLGDSGGLIKNIRGVGYKILE